MAWTTTISQPGLAAAAIVSTGSGSRRTVQASVCNPTAGAQTLTAYFIPSGDAAAADTAVYSALNVPAGGTVILSALMNIGIAAGDEIHALASAATSLTVTISVSDL